MPETSPKGSGADLARQALAAYKATARTSPTQAPKKTRPRMQRGMRGNGRDPLTFGALLDKVSAEQGWPKALEGGNILGRWPELCPQFAATVQPVSYDPERGMLELRPLSHTIASGLRLLGGQLAKQINDKLGTPTVRSIRVLPVGAARVIEQPDVAPAFPASEAPVRTRETASPGYRRTLEAHQAAREDGETVGPYVAAAIERQERALANPANREPADEFTDGLAELERASAPVVDRSDAVRRAALARKRQDQTGGGQLPRRAFDVA